VSDERWRCFVAVPLPAELRSALAATVDRWRDRPDLGDLRWTDPHGWHVTLAFLGSIESAAVPRLAAALDDVAAAHAPRILRAGGVGGFPSAGRARVAWYGVDDPDRRLRALARDTRTAVGLDPQAPFRAHVTLARARHDSVDLRPWVREASAPEGRLPVDRVDLMRSHLGRGPARYETLVTAMLRAPRDA
jgi:RNA 2',3'-cyclic 3'-phosphodiesterase